MCSTPTSSILQSFNCLSGQLSQAQAMCIALESPAVSFSLVIISVADVSPVIDVSPPLLGKVIPALQYSVTATPYLLF